MGHDGMDLASWASRASTPLAEASTSATPFSADEEKNADFRERLQGRLYGEVLDQFADAYDLACARRRPRARGGRPGCRRQHRRRRRQAPRRPHQRSRSRPHRHAHLERRARRKREGPDGSRHHGREVRSGVIAVRPAPCSARKRILRGRTSTRFVPLPVVPMRRLSAKGGEVIADVFAVPGERSVHSVYAIIALGYTMYGIAKMLKLRARRRHRDRCSTSCLAANTSHLCRPPSVPGAGGGRGLHGARHPHRGARLSVRLAPGRSPGGPHHGHRRFQPPAERRPACLGCDSQELHVHRVPVPGPQGTGVSAVTVMRR